eukprot:gene4260-772_t
MCHKGHHVLELGQLRSFQCDCPTERSTSKCHFFPADAKTAGHSGNRYNQNFRQRFCLCGKKQDEGEQVMCCVCEEWYHSGCLDMVDAEELRLGWNAPDPHDLHDVLFDVEFLHSGFAASGSVSFVPPAVPYLCVQSLGPKKFVRQLDNASPIGAPAGTHPIPAAPTVVYQRCGSLALCQIGLLSISPDYMPADNPAKETVLNYAPEIALHPLLDGLHHRAHAYVGAHLEELKAAYVRMLTCGSIQRSWLDKVNSLNRTISAADVKDWLKGLPALAPSKMLPKTKPTVDLANLDLYQSSSSDREDQRVSPLAMQKDESQSPPAKRARHRDQSTGGTSPKREDQSDDSLTETGDMVPDSASLPAEGGSENGTASASNQVNCTLLNSAAVVAQSNALSATDTRSIPRSASTSESEQIPVNLPRAPQTQLHDQAPQQVHAGTAINAQNDESHQVQYQLKQVLLAQQQLAQQQELLKQQQQEAHTHCNYHLQHQPILQQQTPQDQQSLLTYPNQRREPSLSLQQEQTEQDKPQ